MYLNHLQERLCYTGERRWFGGYGGGEMYLSLHPNDALDIIDQAVEYPFYPASVLRWNRFCGRVFCDRTFRIQSQQSAHFLCLVGAAHPVPGGSKLTIRVERRWSMALVPLLAPMFMGLIASVLVLFGGLPTPALVALPLFTSATLLFLGVYLPILGHIERNRLLGFVERLFDGWRIPAAVAQAQPRPALTDICAAPPVS
jgi:hypothetical protein